MIKKVTAIFFTVFLLITMASCGSPEPEAPDADYATVRDAALAIKNGMDITGKTIAVTMPEDSAAGAIYFAPDTSVGANLYVTIITDDNNREEVLGLKKGSTVVVTVDAFDNHLVQSIYIFAKKYTIYDKK